MHEPEPKPDRGCTAEFSGILGRKVLVIDDSRTQRSHAVTLVRGLGAAQVLEASDGLEGLGVLEREEDIDLVFCDLEMPRMDGMAFIGEMSARAYRPHLVILSSQESGVLEAVKLMAVSYGLPISTAIPKPLSSEKIIQALSAPPFNQGPAPSPSAAPGGFALTTRDIRAGLDRGEFVCYYQPQVTMQGAHLKGAEALVRWQHPELGVLSPAHFLPRAEEEPDLMSSLTFRVLEHTARQWRSWTLAGLSLELSVNLSAVSLGTAGFSDQILDTVARHDLPPRALVLEITESASVSNLGHTLANLARLRMRGFKLSIDDFGTGYATYEQLERIPFTELKIDMSITRELPRSRKHTILARNLLRLAKDLRLHTVAEGIETQESWDFLKSLGCDRGQGYFLGRPMPADQLRPWAIKDRSHL